jgi:hypothetical protein
MHPGRLGNVLPFVMPGILIKMKEPLMLLMRIQTIMITMELRYHLNKFGPKMS